MAKLSEEMKKSLDSMAREKGMAAVFLLQLFLTSLIYRIMSILLSEQELGELYPVDEGMYGLFSFSILILLGTISIFLMILAGSLTYSNLTHKNKNMGAHILFSVSKMPYATVAFLFPWIFSFGVPILFLFVYGSDYEEICIFTAVYYFIVWIILAKTFFTPYLIIKGRGILDSLKESWTATSHITMEIAVSSGALVFLAYLAILMASMPGSGIYAAGILLIASALIMTYVYAMLAHMFFSGFMENSAIQSIYTAGNYAQNSPVNLQSTPSVLLVGFSEDEVSEIRRKGVPASALAPWARNASLYDISSRPLIYDGDSSWYTRSVCIFAGVTEMARTLLIERIRDVVRRDIIFTSLTPMNSGYTLDYLLHNFLPPDSGELKRDEKEKEMSGDSGGKNENAGPGDEKS